MFDFSHLPNVGNGADVQVFRAAQQWQTWMRPRGKTMLRMIAIGSGAGGGGGFSAAAASARGGGGGGGGGALALGTFALGHLPDLLFVRVGKGGAGGNAGTAGVSGELSYVQTRPDTGTPIGERILLTGGSVPAGGGAGTAAAAGAAGAAAATGNLNPLWNMGQIAVFAPLAAAAGGVQTGAVGGTVTAVQNSTFGGAGGAGVTSADFSGGAFTGSGLWRSAAGGLAVGGRGVDGYEMTASGVLMPVPTAFTPGTGGGSNNAGTGGAGGIGGPGCGGGGGGGGVTGGAGGAGGDGLVVMVSW
jgi:hypothetical protein